MRAPSTRPRPDPTRKPARPTTKRERPTSRPGSSGTPRPQPFPRLARLLVLGAATFVALGGTHLALPSPTAAQDTGTEPPTEVRDQESVRAGAEQEAVEQEAVEQEAAEQGWLGIAFRDPARRTPNPGPRDRSARFGDGDGPSRDGVVVSGVLRGGPADRAGIRPGHVLVRFEGEPVGPRELSRRAREIRVGDSVTLTVRSPAGDRRVELMAAPRPASAPPSLNPEVMARVDSIQEAVRQRLDALRERMHGDRGGQAPPWSLRPPDAFDSGDGPPDRRGLRPGAPPDAPPLRRPPRPYSLGYEFVAGARVVALNDPLAEYFEVDRGVLTVDVLDGSPAQEAGLRPGDVIVAVGDEPVASVEDLRTILLGPRGRSVELEIVRQGEERRIRLPS